MSDILDIVGTKYYGACCGDPIHIDTHELREINTALSEASEMQDALETKIEELAEELKDMAASIDRAETIITTAQRLAHANNLPEHFTAAFDQVLHGALKEIGDLRKHSINEIAESMSGSIWTVKTFS